MLLERDLIQSVGFRNVREGGEITGFQVRVRIPNYRGLAAPLIDGISVRVDDVVDVGPEVPLWTLQGRTYTLAELWDSDGVRWPLEEAAVVTVPHPGGLSDGVHEVSVEILLRASYIPIEHQPSRTRAARHVTLSPEADGAPFQYGVSLYSYTDDFNTVLGLEGAMAAIADIGATGIEILGEGHIPGYPEPSAAWVDRWFALLETYGLEPTNYGS
ncbi:MAG: sugar phosphate isomerase/epimerase, partial [Microbacterium sp.]|nr:sugar phosphate isomerase/epimerase [Microbacterium sp.]